MRKVSLCINPRPIRHLDRHLLLHFQVKFLLPLRIHRLDLYLRFLLLFRPAALQPVARSVCLQRLQAIQSRQSQPVFQQHPRLALRNRLHGTTSRPSSGTLSHATSWT